MSTPAPSGFTVKPVRNRTVGALKGASTLGLVLHVQAGDGGLSGWFSNPTAQASSTWWAGKAGAREQYGNPDTDKFWAQSAGNTTYHSIETEGQPSQSLTAAQIETVAVAYAWGHARYGWPFRLAEKPGERGLGWHGMGGKAWGGHTGCPGDLRKAQRSQIIARAQQIAGGTTALQEDDMANVSDDQLKLLLAAAGRVMANDAAARVLNDRDGATINTNIGHARDQIVGGIKALAAGLGPTVEAAVAKALEANYDATVTLSPKEPS